MASCLSVQPQQVKSFEDTIKTQEKVISRMQSVLETQLASRSNQTLSSNMPATVSLSRSMPLKQELAAAAAAVASATPASSAPANESSVQVSNL